MKIICPSSYAFFADEDVHDCNDKAALPIVSPAVPAPIVRMKLRLFVFMIDTIVLRV